MKTINLINSTAEALNTSYSPYSKFRVGAALLTDNDKIITGANIENASYGATVCAERVAIFKAVQTGYKEFKSIAIIGGPKSLQPNSGNSSGESFVSPCGICRQVLREFVNPKDFEVILVDYNNFSNYKTFSLDELLPLSFGPDNLKNKEVKGKTNPNSKRS